MDEVYLSDDEFAALEYLVTVGHVFAKDVEFPRYWDFVRLKSLDFAKMEFPDPNFLYMLPEDRREAYQFKITTTGYNEYLRLKQVRDERTKQEESDEAAKQAEDKRWRKDVSRSWVQFWLNILFSAIGFAAGVFIEHYFAILEVLLVIVG